MLEFDDIQHIILTRVPALSGQCRFLSFREPAQARAWLAGVIGQVQSARAVSDSLNSRRRWASVAFTWDGLRALGLEESSLATFPEEFPQGMAARAQVIGDTGANHPDYWVDKLASPDLHAIIILLARDAAERQSSVQEHQSVPRANSRRGSPVVNRC